LKEVVKYSLLKNSANRYFGTAASKGEELIKAKRDKNRQFELFFSSNLRNLQFLPPGEESQNGEQPMF